MHIPRVLWVSLVLAFAAHSSIAQSGPPDAVGDSYGITLNPSLLVTAPGVLANDVGNQLEAQLVSAPTNAHVFELRTDGSFVYTANPGYLGPDSFSYRALNGAGISNPVEVLLDVQPADDPRLADAVQFATVGDYGVISQAASQVDALIASWDPDFVLTLGDNNYEVGSAQTIDSHIGSHYSSFIFPYEGSYGPGADFNRFFPTIGNHDFNTDNAEPYLDYFALPGNERYYKFTWGPVEFFTVSSDPREFDGADINGVQAAWLEAALAASTAPWKVVYFHHPPYSSVANYGFPNMRWPFESWGADVVLAGHAHVYERLELDGGIPLLVNGLGGRNIYEFLFNEPRSRFKYRAAHGAQRVTATECLLSFAFYSVDAPTVAIDPMELDRCPTPTAVDDEYEIAFGTSLVLPAPGVLANDMNSTGVTVELLTPPTQSQSFTLAPDGALTYVPITGYAGLDEFTYQVRKDSLFSSVATVRITVLEPPPPAIDLVLAAGVDEDQPVIGTDVVVTFTLTNEAGNTDATGIDVTFDVPAGLSLAGSSAATGTVSGSVWSIPSLAQGVSTTLALTLNTDALGSVDACGFVSAATPDDLDSNPGPATGQDDEACVNVDVLETPPPPSIDLALTAAVDEAQVFVGAQVVVSFALTNEDGNADATGIQLTFDVPAGLSLTGSNPATGTVTGSVWSIAALAQGATTTLELTLQADAVGSVDACAFVSAAAPDDLDSQPGPATGQDDEACVSITVLEAPEPEEDLCYAVADNGSSSGSSDVLTRVLDGVESLIGDTGTEDIEALARDPLTGILYATDADQFGTLNENTGAFSLIGTPGTAQGAQGSRPLSDIDGLAFDPRDGMLYATSRSTGANVLVKIDPAAGTIIEDVFGPGQDYASLDIDGNVDDIAIDQETGRAIVIHDNGSNSILFDLDLVTGAVTQGVTLPVRDIEGLAFAGDGTLIGSAGSEGRLIWTIDPDSGSMTERATLGIDGNEDYEAVTCVVQAGDPPPPSIDLALTAEVDDAQPFVGSNVVVTFTLNNEAGNTNAAGIELTFEVPAGLSLTGSNPATGTVSGSVWSIPSLGQTDATTLELTLQTSAVGAVDVCAFVSAAAPDDLDSEPGPAAGQDDEACVTVGVQEIPAIDLMLAASVTDPTPTEGATTVVTFTVTNEAGNADASAIEVTFDVPAGLSLTGSNPATGTVSGSGWSIPALGQGLSTTLQLTLQADEVGAVDVCAFVSAAMPDDLDSQPGAATGQDDEACTAVTVLEAPAIDLLLAAEADEVQPIVGSDVVVTFTLTNEAGNTDASGIEVTFEVPAGLSLSGSTPGTGSVSGTVWTVPSLAQGDASTLQLALQSDAGGAVDVCAFVSAASPDDLDSEPGAAIGQDDEACATIDVQQAPAIDLALSAGVDNSEPIIGTDVVVTFTLTNEAGNTDATGIDVTFDVPTGLSLAGSTPATGTVSGSVWSIPSLAQGVSTTLALTLNTDALGSVDACGFVSAATPDDLDSNPGPATGQDDEACVNVDVLETPPPPSIDLALTAAVDEAQVFVGAQVVVSFALTNEDGNADATGIQLTFDVPAGLSLTGSNPATGTVTGSVWSIAALAQGATTTLELTLQADAVGSVDACAFVSAAAPDDLDSQPGPATGQDDEACVSITVLEAPEPEEDLCYAVADNGSSSGSSDVLTRVLDGVESLIGDTGTEDIEALARDPLTGILYATDADQFGTLNENTGAFSLIGTPGTAQGAQGSRPLSDIDGLAFDPRDGMLYATSRSTGANVLVKIDPAAGTIIEDVFGPGQDYASLDIDGNVDDIAIDQETGRAIVIHDNGSNSILFDLDLVTGAVTQGVTLPVRDIEGLAFAGDGTLIGSAGSEGRLIWTIDPDSGSMTERATLGIDGNEDYEAVTCVVQAGDPPPPSIDLALTAEVDDAQPFVGSNVVVTFTLNNEAGNTNAAGIELTFEVPAGLSLTGSNPATGTVSGSVWSIPSLGQTDATTLELTLQTSAVGAVDVCAFVSAAAPDDLDSEPGPAAGQDDEACVTVGVQEIPAIDLMLAASVTDPTPTEGATTVVTFTVTNEAGNADASAIEVTFDVPAGLSLTGSNPATGTVSGSGWSIPALGQGLSTTLQLTLQADEVGAVDVCAFVSAAMPDDLDSQPGAATGQDDEACTAVTVLEAPAIDLLLAAEADEVQPIVGSDVVVTFTLTNEAGNTDASGIEVTFEVPAGLSLSGSTPGTGSVSGTVWTVPSLAQGDASTLQLALQSDAGGAVDVCAFVSAASPDDLDSEPGAAIGQDDEACATIDVQQAPAIDLALSAGVDNSEPIIGTDVVVTFTLTNEAGNTDATGIDVTFDVPTGLSLAGSTPATGTVSGSVWSIPSLAQGVSTTLALTLNTDALGSVDVCGFVSAATPDDLDSNPGPATGQDDEACVNVDVLETPPPPSIDLALTAAVDEAEPVEGSDVVVTLTLTNEDGNSDATGIDLTFDVPAGLTLVGSSPATGTVTGSVWSIPSLAQGASTTLQLTLRADAVGAVDVCAYVSAASPDDLDSDPGAATGEDDEDCVAISVLARPVIDLMLATSVDEQEPTVGSSVVVTLTLTNEAGNSDANGIDVTFEVPTGLSLTGSNPTSGTVTGSVWSITSLAQGASTTVQLTLLTDAVGVVETCAFVSAAAPEDLDSVPGAASGQDDEACVTVGVQEVPAIDLALAAAVDLAQPIVGSDVVVTFTLTNEAGNTDATGIGVSFAVPAGLTLTGSDPATGAVAGSVWTIPSLAVGTSTTLQLTLQTDVVGSIDACAFVSAAAPNDLDSQPGAATGQDDEACVTIGVRDVPPPASDVCYLVADNDGAGSNTATSVDILVAVFKSDNTEIVIGPTGTALIEAAAFSPFDGVLYATDGQFLGTLDLTTGLFTSIGSAGSGTGTLGQQTFGDIDGLTFDPTSGALYGSVRRSEADLLVMLNTATGGIVPGVFGGDDYLVLGGGAALDVDDLAIDPVDGSLYAVVDPGPSESQFVRIDRTTGSITLIATLDVAKVEGLTFDGDGTLLAAVGSSGKQVVTIDRSTGVTTLQTTLGADGNQDYEAIDCLTNTPNSISFRAVDTHGAAAAGLMVELYRDLGSDGYVDAGDARLDGGRTLEDGSIQFTTASLGAVVVRVGGSVRTAAFDGFGQTRHLGDVTVGAATSTGNESSEGVPDTFRLASTYPNPFNPQASISIELPETARVRLSVFDMLGREIVVLIDGVTQAGSQVVRFDADGLPSGTYLVRFASPGGIFTRSVTLLR